MTVGVVGAGLTGLAVTHYLRERDVDCVTFETASEPGGVVDSFTVDGRVLEAGPQRIRLTSSLDTLVDDLGLRGEVLEASNDLPLYVYCDGALREVPRSLRAFVRTDLLSWRGKLRVFAEPFTGAGDPGETAADLFTRKFGDEAYRNMLGPLFGGIFGSDPAEMPVEHALAGLLRVEQKHGSLLKPALKRAVSSSESPPVTFQDGLQTLPNALYEANSDVIRLETPVEGIRKDGSGWILDTSNGSVSVDEVIVTTPADVSADLLSTVAPDSASSIAELNYNPLALVYLDADSDATGFGYQIRRDDSFSTLGVSWNASMFDREGVYTCFLGGMEAPELVEESDETLGRIAREEFETIMDVEADVLAVRRLHRGFPAYDKSWSALDDVALPDDIHLATNYTARMGIPSRIREAKQVADRLAE